MYYCEVTRRTFSNKNVYEAHKKGKRYLKALAALKATVAASEANNDVTAEKSAAQK